MASRVYDASAFYAGIPFASSEVGLTTTPIYDEIKHIKKSHGVLDTLLETGRLKIIEPDLSNVEFILKEAKKNCSIFEYIMIFRFRLLRQVRNF